MANYTTQLRSVCEVYAGLNEGAGYDSVEEIIEKSRGKIFNFNYPIFDENYRKVLETKIIKHYYTREIGLETVGLWKLFLNSRMNEIMPYYNQLYASSLLEFNPLYDVDLTRKHNVSSKGSVDTTGKTEEKVVDASNENGTENVKGDSSVGYNDSVTNDNTSNTTNDSTVIKGHIDKYADTPQGAIDNLENDRYLTNARMISDNDITHGYGSVKDNGNSKTVSSTDTDSSTRRESDRNETRNTDRTGSDSRNQLLNNTEDYLEQVSGKQGAESYSKMLMEYRSTFLNIDLQIIDDLKNLFFNLY